MMKYLESSELFNTSNALWKPALPDSVIKQRVSCLKKKDRIKPSVSTAFKNPLMLILFR